MYTTQYCAIGNSGPQVFITPMLCDECQILYIWTPWFTLVRPLTVLFSDVFVSFCVIVFYRSIREEWQNFMWKYLEIRKSWKVGQSIELKSWSIEILPKVDRSNKSRLIEISQNLLLQKRARTPNQERLHDKKQFSLWFSQQNTLVLWPWLSLAREEP